MAVDEKLTGNDEPTLNAVEQDSVRPTSVQSTTVASGQRTTGQVGPFLLLELLGRGGMGEVHRAVHVKLKKTVALELLPAERAADEQAMSRFRREVQVISGLAHLNIVRFERQAKRTGFRIS